MKEQFISFGKKINIGDGFLISTWELWDGVRKSLDHMGYTWEDGQDMFSGYYYERYKELTCIIVTGMAFVRLENYEDIKNKYKIRECKTKNISKCLIDKIVQAEEMLVHETGRCHLYALDLCIYSSCSSCPVPFAKDAIQKEVERCLYKSNFNDFMFWGIKK